MPYDHDAGQWRPSGQHMDEKKELSILIAQYMSGDDPTRSMQQLDDWVDVTMGQAYQSGRNAGLFDGAELRGGWWSRNWIAVAFFAILVGGMLAIGLINGWS